jgi:hypothetical protein
MADKIPVFISASFADEAQPTIDWFIKMAESVGFESVWLKKKNQPRPVKEKIKEAVKECPAMIQILTKDLISDDNEMGTVKEEYPWYEGLRPDGSMGFFIEKGIKLKGQQKYEVDPVEFESEHLDAIAPEVSKYLLDLKKRVLSRMRKERDSKDICIGILHGAETWGQCDRRATSYGPNEWDDWFSAHGFNTARISACDIDSSAPDSYDAIINPFGENYPEEDGDEEKSIRRIVEYVSKGGIFVCTGGWPFYYAFTPNLEADSNRLYDQFQVKINNEQLWATHEETFQPKGSLTKYGELTHKGGEFGVQVWRPVSENSGNVEMILGSKQRSGSVIGHLRSGKGSLILTGMDLQGESEFEKLASFLEVFLTGKASSSN